MDVASSPSAAMNEGDDSGGDEHEEDSYGEDSSDSDADTGDDAAAADDDDDDEDDDDNNDDDDDDNNDNNEHNESALLDPSTSVMKRRAGRTRGGPAVATPARKAKAHVRQRRRKRRSGGKRSCIQRYLCEVGMFALLSILFISNYMVTFKTEVETEEEMLPERRKVRFWDWPSKAEQERIHRDVWHKAVSTIRLPNGEDVSLQLSTGDEHNFLEGHVQPPSFFFNHIILGLTAHYPADAHILRNATEYNKAANEDLLKDIKAMSPKPDFIMECDIEARGRGLELGWALAFKETRRDSVLAEAESAVRLFGRMYGQMAVYKWFTHQYGKDRSDHAVIIQAIEPTGAAVWHMRTSGPVYRVRFDPHHHKRPYQVSGPYQHTPQKESPQEKNTRERRRKRAEMGEKRKQAEQNGEALPPESEEELQDRIDKLTRREPPFRGRI